MSKIKLCRIYGKHIPNAGVAEDPELEKDDLYFLPDGEPVRDWKPLRCEIIKGEGFFDYQACVHRFRLCSQQLKDILDNGKGSDDKIQWLEATVTWNGETRPYYVLHFHEDVDVVDLELSDWQGNRFGKEPVFVERKLVNHNVLSIPKSCIMLFVKPEIAKEIKRQKLTGMVFEEADVRDL